MIKYYLVMEMIRNGIDLVKVSRFDKLKLDNNFMTSVFNEEEINYINKHNNNSSTIAGLFASKEAFLKSLNKGINDYKLKDILILHELNSNPYIVLLGKLNDDFKSLKISLSISHDGDYAIASVIVIF